MSGRRNTPRSSRRRSTASKAAKQKHSKRAAEHADAAFLNARIVTLNSRDSRAQALTIRDGHIGTIGTNQEILSVLEDDAPIWNLRGAIVLPGFTDCHTHLVEYGLQFSGANLRTVFSIAGIQNVLRKQAEKTGPGRWVLGYGWDQEKLRERRFPSRHDLDEAVADKPVCIFRVCEHVCVVNSAAIRLANITAMTSPPIGGVIDLDGKTGEPTGVLRENAMNLALSSIPPREDREVGNAVSLAMNKALAAGLTSVHCVVDNPQHIQVLQAMNRQGQLKLRIYLLITDEWLNPATGMGISTGFGDEMLRIQAIKIFTDGSLGAHTAALEQPYSDEPNSTGVLIHSQDELNTTVQTSARNGLQVAIHAIGDRAIAMALTAIENANLTIPRSKELRHRIEHASVLNRSLIERIRQSKVIASVQPHFIASDVWIPERVGRERAKLVYPLKSLTRVGARVVGGSDCPIEPIDPLEGICAAVSSAPEAYGERVDAKTAVEMFTKSAAYATHEEKLKGTIEEGKLADLVVLDRDPVKVAPEEIPKIKVLATFVGGRLVFASKRFRAMQVSNVRGLLSRRCS